MSLYRTFTATDAVEYARQYGRVSEPQALVSADEIGDGNLNLVFKIRDREGVSRVIVKQALPYVRCVGESWPLTLDRARIEAETLLVHGGFCPRHTVKVLHHDPELAVMVQEDLSDHRIWRSELVQGNYHPLAAGQLAEYLAQTLFHTSDFLSVGAAEEGGSQPFHQSRAVPDHRRSVLYRSLYRSRGAIASRRRCCRRCRRCVRIRR